jgi:hypothetical protein
MRNMAVGANAQLTPVAAEHETLEEDVVRLGDRGGEEQDGKAQHGAKASVTGADESVRLFYVVSIGALARLRGVLDGAGAPTPAEAE